VGRMTKPLKLCANGCGVPPDPPSLVICRACQDKITATLHQMLDDAEQREEARRG
jgi:hypothetical protein